MLYKRGCVYWYKFRWTVKSQEGVRENYLIRKSARTASLRRAREVEEEHRRALRIGLIHPADRWPAPKQQAPQIPTLREFSKQFQDFVNIQKKHSTARFYKVSVTRLLCFAPISDAKLSDITGEIVSKYSNWRLGIKSGQSVLTINGDLRTLRRMLNLAHEWGLIQQTPTVHELPGGKARERVISFAEEIRYLAKASRTVRDAATLAVDTGMRPNSELFLLEWSNVHLETTQDAPLGYIHVSSGKTDAATRNIPLTPRTREILLARRELLVGPKASQRRCGDLRYVFTGVGNSGHLVTVQHAHEKAMTDAGLPPFEFYCWRHTFGTRCAESRMDKFSLARLMGHSSPGIAERYYIHVTEPHVMTGFERFSQYHATKLLEAFKQQSDAVQ
jgi:integrase